MRIISEAFIVIFVLSLAFGGIYLLAELFEERFPIHISLISGISLSYYFLVLLPEISENLPVFPLSLQVYTYLFVLIGFSFIHLVEKFILQHVEVSAQKRVRELLKMQENLKIVEDNLSEIMSQEVLNDNLDIDALREIIDTSQGLRDQEQNVKNEIVLTKKKIHDHITNDLNRNHAVFSVIYRIIKGIVLVDLLARELISGILFFILILLMAIISEKIGHQKLFSDLDIRMEYKTTKRKQLILGGSIFIGITLGLLFEYVLQIGIEIIFIMFSFISGVILYKIIKEVIPEKEKGRPSLFMVGLIGFSIFIIILKTLEALYV